MVNAVKPGGLVLDLQVIRPNPVIETDGRVVCEIDGAPLFRKADAATAAIDALVQDGRLAEESVHDHDVRKHYDNGAALSRDFERSERQVPKAALGEVLALEERCILRERCRLRRLAIV
jgi:hypothetical protein